MTNQRQAVLELERIERTITAKGGLSRIWAKLVDVPADFGERKFAVELDYVDQTRSIDQHLTTSSICYLAQTYIGIDASLVRKALEEVASWYCLVTIPHE